MEESDKEMLGEEVQYVERNDWFLQHLVSTVNKSRGIMGITLMCEGAIVTGNLIGGKKYFEIFASDFSSASHPDDQEGIKMAFNNLAEKLYPEVDENVEDASPPQYIHLENARIVSPNGDIPSSKGTLWRGKISAVSGFILGVLSRSN